jgi:hypothetical protein
MIQSQSQKNLKRQSLHLYRERKEKVSLRCSKTPGARGMRTQKAGTSWCSPGQWPEQETDWKTIQKMAIVEAME